MPMTPEQREREQRAFEALIVLCVRFPDEIETVMEMVEWMEKEDDPDWPQSIDDLPQGEFSAEEREAIDRRLGPDFIERLIAGTWTPNED